VKHGRITEPKDDNIICRMPIARWLTKDTDKNSKYFILTAFTQLQWLCELD